MITTNCQIIPFRQHRPMTKAEYVRHWVRLADQLINLRDGTQATADIIDIMQNRIRNLATEKADRCIT